ncbi:MAG: ABC transporter permease [Actinobacteria bacterium]|jgi:simple sugar transport system permease protein|nr:ABC transporter permease [Actinomycetota bacterium]
MKKFIEKLRNNMMLPFLAFIFAFFIGGIIIVLSDAVVMSQISSPGKFLTSAGAKIGNSYLAVFQGSIFDINLSRQSGIINGFYPLSETIVTSTPLILSGLSVALAFRSGLFNIGAQGQFIFGAIGASYVGFHYNFSPVLHVTIAIFVGILLGGLVGGLVGLLKAKTGAHEVIVTIMLNYVASLFILWLLKTSTFLRPGRQDPLAPEVNPSAQLPKLFGENLRIHAGIFIALIAAVFVWWILNKSTLGFKFRAVGSNANAARTAGISIPFVTTMTMFICGGLAGLGGAVHLLGTEHALAAGIAGSLGFDAITVALLGQATPIGTVFGAFLFGALQTGSRTLLSNTGTSPDIVQVIQALIVLFIAAPALMKSIFRIKKSLTDKSMTAKGWNG